MDMKFVKMFTTKDGARLRYYHQNMFCPFFYLPELVAPDEKFVPITNLQIENVFPDRYVVSNYGRVFDVLKYKFIEPNYTRMYHQTHLATIDNKLNVIMKNILTHRLVMLAFCYRPDYKNLEVNHLNGNHLDNRLVNLEWCTKNENTQYAVEHEQIQRGENASRALLTNEQAEEIYKMIEAGERVVDIANKTGLNYDLIKGIRQGKSYKYIGAKYNLPPTKKHADKLPDEVVIEIANRLSKGEPMTEISKATGVSVSRITSIKTGECYKDLTENINMGEVKQLTFITDEEVVRICELLQEGKDTQYILDAIKNEFNHVIPDYKVSRIRRRVHYQNISCNYSW